MDTLQNWWQEFYDSAIAPATYAAGIAGQTPTTTQSAGNQQVFNQGSDDGDALSSFFSGSFVWYLVAIIAILLLVAYITRETVG